MSSRASRQTADVRDTRADQLRRIGGALREARQARGEDLYAVAETLRIKPSYLFALEEGDLSMTPGRAYALGFLRSYADHLGFDGAEVVRLVKEALNAAPPAPELVVPQPRDDRRPHGLLVAASILLLGVLYGSWHILWRDQPVLERVAAVPGELGRVAAEMIAGPPSLPPAPPPPVVSRAAVPPPPPPPVAPRVGEAPPRVERAELQALVAAEPDERVELPAPPSGRRDAAGAFAAERPAPRLAEGPSPAELLAALDAGRPRAAPEAGEGRVVLVARESAWVQIRSTSRDYVRTRTLEPGDRLILPERDDLALWTGNAGGIEVVVEGRSLGVLGESGKVLRDVPLAPDALRARLAGG
ncbi:MAG: hypothetical protein KatS3mg117_1132 [Geminicoccaceae bacterium]|nr:MAG: hypothetical protein KatS3mg117_1132 [Geminicoccaceae bacterium]